MQVYEEIKKKFRWREAEDTTVFSPSSGEPGPRTKEGPFSSKGKKFWMSRRVFDQMSGRFFGH